MLATVSYSGSGISVIEMKGLRHVGDVAGRLSGIPVRVARRWGYGPQTKHAAYAADVPAHDHRYMLHVEPLTYDLK